MRLRGKIVLRGLARPAGLEPAASDLEGRCSIQLSYGRLISIVHANEGSSLPSVPRLQNTAPLMHPQSHALGALLEFRRKNARRMKGPCIRSRALYPTELRAPECIVPENAAPLMHPRHADGGEVLRILAEKQSPNEGPCIEETFCHTGRGSINRLAWRITVTNGRSHLTTPDNWSARDESTRGRDRLQPRREPGVRLPRHARRHVPTRQTMPLSRCLSLRDQRKT
jgi:hypothetical protein